MRRSGTRSSKWSTLEGQFTFKSAGTWILMEMAHKTESRRQKENWKTSRHHRRRKGKARQMVWKGRQGCWCYGDGWQTTNARTGRWSVQSKGKAKRRRKLEKFLFLLFALLVCWQCKHIRYRSSWLALFSLTLTLSLSLDNIFAQQ